MWNEIMMLNVVYALDQCAQLTFFTHTFDDEKCRIKKKKN